jgi:hypothetical protein
MLVIESPGFGFAFRYYTPFCWRSLGGHRGSARLLPAAQLSQAGELRTPLSLEGRGLGEGAAM